MAERDEEPMASRRKKIYFCNVVSEEVKITLTNKFSLNPKFINEQFVQCNQLECQFADLNKYPCPLSPDLFAAEI